MATMKCFSLLFLLVVICSSDARTTGTKSTPQACFDNKGRLNPDCEKRFVFYNFRTSWTRAQDNCKSGKKQLATINTIEEENALETAIENYGQEGTWWLGASDQRDAGLFRWVGESNKRTSFTKWQPGQPDRGGDACLTIGTDFMWYDEPCDNLQGYICEYYDFPSKEETTPRPQPTNPSPTQPQEGYGHNQQSEHQQPSTRQEGSQQQHRQPTRQEGSYGQPSQPTTRQEGSQQQHSQPTTRQEGSYGQPSQPTIRQEGSYGQPSQPSTWQDRSQQQHSQPPRRNAQPTFRPRNSYRQNY